MVQKAPMNWRLVWPKITNVVVAQFAPPHADDMVPFDKIETVADGFTAMTK
jgi:hypothetical protein